MSITIKKVGDFEFPNIVAKFKNSKNKSIPRIVANTAKNHYLKGFNVGAMRGGGYTDASRNGWLARKRETRLSVRENILVATGRLRRSIKVIKTAFNEIIIGSNVDYASYHNEGAGKIPKREFLGDSKVLSKRIIVTLKNELNLIFKK